MVVEAEYFYKQSLTENRAWYINSPAHRPMVWPDWDAGSYDDSGGIDRFMCRGAHACRSEWSLICATHNLLKLWRSSTACWN